MSGRSSDRSDPGRIFGRGIAFPVRVGADGRIEWSEGERNVREALRIVLLTEPGERLMLPEFGGGLRRSLLEPNTVATRQLVKERIERALTIWEPRVVVESVSVDPAPEDPQSAIATIEYRLVASQARERVAVTVSLAGSGA